ncbi:MAG: aminotransferase class I/II-fold pyridoxal phosphate-dependent enzyme, partial [bacterium]
YKTYYVLGGSTLSNHIAIISSVCEKDKIVIPRNSHKSIFSGVILSGATPVFIYPRYDYNFNIDCNINFEEIKSLIDKEKISAIVISHPTYYGLVSDIKNVAGYLNEKGVLVIVDQAWGAHFKFYEKFPICSTDTDSHIIIMSPHKTLTAFTQASVLHLNHSLVKKFPHLVPKIHQTVLMLNSTSPSSLLFFSLDYTQFILNKKKNLFKKVYNLAMYTLEGLKRIDPEIVFENDDKTKIVINLSKYGISGYELEEILFEKYRIQVEMSDIFNILILVTLGDGKKEMDYLLGAIKQTLDDVKNGFIKPKNLIRKITEYPDWPELIIPPRQAYISQTEEVELQNSINRMSAEIITTYPPGIPILIPGEKITKQIVKYIEHEINYGTKITGIHNIKERKIRVVKE